MNEWEVRTSMLQLDFLARQSTLQHVQIVDLDLLVIVHSHFVQLGTEVDARNVERVFELLGGRYRLGCCLQKDYAQVFQRRVVHRNVGFVGGNCRPKAAIRQRLLAKLLSRSSDFDLKDF